MNNEKPKHKKSLARECAFKAVFAWRISQTDIEKHFLDVCQDPYFKRVDKIFAGHLVKLFEEKQPLINKQIDPLISLQSSRNLNDVERSILELASVELLFVPETPAKVVINEYINLCKVYGTDQGFKLVNAVLHQLHQQSQGQL